MQNVNVLSVVIQNVIVLIVITLSVVMLSVVMLSVVMCIIMLSVVAPGEQSNSDPEFKGSIQTATGTGKKSASVLSVLGHAEHHYAECHL
jgi:hypothetical protein